jgi:hypothetical protein
MELQGDANGPIRRYSATVAGHRVIRRERERRGGRTTTSMYVFDGIEYRRFGDVLRRIAARGRP